MGFNQLCMLWCKPVWFKYLNLSLAFTGSENVLGAEDRLEKPLKVLHGGKNLTKVEVVEAI